MVIADNILTKMKQKATQMAAADLAETEAAADSIKKALIVNAKKESLVLQVLFFCLCKFVFTVFIIKAYIQGKVLSFLPRQYLSNLSDAL